ncbi:MAG: protease complex subunit PrcB family protein [Thermoanaerobacteraceae bacterium]|nr:protease complex subunit PrcB family protein [Thermoanaerobacteraceae bacterium]
MKKIALFCLLALVMLSLLVSGCNDKPANNTSNENSGTPLQEKPIQAPDQDNAPQHQAYPEEVSTWLNTFKPLFAADYRVVDGKTFFMVSWGEKPSGGYHVKIRNIEQKADKTIVRVEFSEPKPGEMVTEALTYPYAVEAVEGVVQEPVVFTTADGKTVIPRIIGLEGDINDFESRNENIAVLNFQYRSGQVTVRGIARAFEGSLAYFIRDTQGNVIDEGIIITEAGAPDWGAFQLRIKDIPPAAEKLVLFSTSAKDGSKINSLEFTLAPAK